MGKTLSPAQRAQVDFLVREFKRWPTEGVTISLRDDTKCYIQSQRAFQPAIEELIAEAIAITPHHGHAPRPDAWMYFLPVTLREAFFREWVEERREHRDAGRSEFYIWATLVSQLLTMFVIGGKDRMVALVRKLWTPANG